MDALQISAEKLKKFAMNEGADMVGISSVDRWSGIPPEENPLSIFPDAKSVIVVALRAPRGSLRGIEEGTYWAAYAQSGYGYINLIWMPALLRKVSIYLEDRGYEAVPVTHQFPGGFQGGISGRAVRPGQPAPDIYINFRLTALFAGLGEIGYSKVFLTKNFGPRQRFGVVITDAEITPDPIAEPGICDRCMACVRECPAEAINPTQKVVKKYKGGQAEWGKLDVAKCTYCHHGMLKAASPFIDCDPKWQEIHSDDDNEIYRKAKEISDPVRKNIPYTRGLLNTFPHHGAVCGGKGCMRACMIHLEEKGRITNLFHNKFRKRPVW